MANHDSAVKQHRQDEKKRVINRINRSKMKNKIKALRRKVAAGQIDDAAKLLPDAIAIIDATIRKGTVHKNTGARYKSRLVALLKNSAK